MTDPKRDHSEIREALAAYSLGAIDGSEQREIELHLDSCASCRAQLRWLSPAIDMLPASVEQLEPPQRLKRSLMRVVDAEAAERASAARVAERSSRRRGLLSMPLLRPIAGLATVALVAAGVLIGVLAGESGDDLVPTSGGSTTVEARAIEDGKNVSAELEVGDGPAVLYVHRIPELANDKVFQVWIQREGGYRPSATFVPRSDGTAEAAITQSLDGAEAVAVTSEPRGGSESPTTLPFMEVPLGDA